MLTAGYRKFLSLTLPPVAIGARLQLPAIIALLTAVALALAWLPLKLAVGVVGGALFLALAVIEPLFILLVLIPVIPFSSLAAMPLGGANAGAMELLLLLAVAVWLLKLLTAETITGQPLTVRHGPLLVPFAILLGGMALTWLNTLSIRASLVETIKWVEMFVLYLFIINLIPLAKIKWMVLVMLLTGMAQATLGLYQFVFKVGPDGFLLFGGQFLRAYGTFAQPNPYGGYIGLVLPLALSVALWAIESATGGPAVIWSKNSRPAINRGIQLTYRLGRWLALSLPLLLLLAALFASQSRGAWLGFAVGGLVTVVVRSQKYAALVLAGALVVSVAMLVGSISLSPGQAQSDNPLAAVTQRFVDAGQIFEIKDVAITPVTDANFATVERLAHWQAARNMWRDNPWLGVGFGNYAVVYPAYAVGRWLDPLGHAHNYLLNLGAETGLVGFSVYTIFWVWSFGLIWLAVRRSSGFYRAVAAGSLGILAHLQVHNLVDNLYVQGMYLHVAVILGVSAIIYLSSKRA